MDNATKPIVVSENAGGIDGSMALLRYLIVVMTALPAMLAFLKARDLVGLYQFLQGNQGAAVIAAMVALGTAGYGIIKTWRRGAQIATVAADVRVPEEVATTT